MRMHHAQLYFGDSLADATVPVEYHVPSADIVHIIRDSFSIADARELTAQALMKPFLDDLRVFVIVTHEINLEAQNALLKLFEEPPQHAVFHLVVPQNAFLLPTLRSRLSVVLSHKAEQTSSTSFEAFMKATYAERIAKIALMTKEKDTQWITELLRGCEQWIETDVINRTSELRTLLFVREHIDRKGSSAKMLLEALALSLPSKA
jgi:DNA polymerase III delta prime subunit